MRTQILELSNGWESYWKTKRVDGLNPIHKLVVDEIPKVLSSWLTRPEKYKVQGSDGLGNLNRTPWVAVFNKEITTTATQGYYPVFLFKDNMQEMVLEIGFGATQFEAIHGTGKKFFDEISKAVKAMQSSSHHLLNVLEPSVLKRISTNPTKLNSATDFKLRAYEKCAIYSLTYSLSSLPSEESLKSDFLEIMKLYDAMAESSVLPSDFDYAVEDFVTPAVEDDFQVMDFFPKQKKKSNNKGTGNSSTERRYSRASEKIGKIGEEFVYKLEVKSLQKLGRQDLASQVIWHRNYPEDRTPGWDITSFEPDGSKKLIEVKSSKGKDMSNIVLTSNEWDKALEHSDNDRYQIYLVYNILSKPEVAVIKNPVKWVHEQTLKLEVNSYLLNLTEEA